MQLHWFQTKRGASLDQELVDEIPDINHLIRIKNRVEMLERIDHQQRGDVQRQFNTYAEPLQGTGKGFRSLHAGFGSIQYRILCCSFRPPNGGLGILLLNHFIEKKKKDYHASIDKAQRRKGMIESGLATFTTLSVSETAIYEQVKAHYDNLGLQSHDL